MPDPLSCPICGYSQTAVNDLSIKEHQKRVHPIHSAPGNPELPAATQDPSGCVLSYGVRNLQLRDRDGDESSSLSS